MNFKQKKPVDRMCFHINGLYLKMTCNNYNHCFCGGDAGNDTLAPAPTTSTFQNNLPRHVSIYYYSVFHRQIQFLNPMLKEHFSITTGSV